MVKARDIVEERQSIMRRLDKVDGASSSAVGRGPVDLSVALSLKRIADALEKIAGAIGDEAEAARFLSRGGNPNDDAG